MWLGFCALALLMALSGCTGVHRTYSQTPEGWVIVYTDSQNEVAAACGEPESQNIVGCSSTAIGTSYPAEFCDIYIYTEYKPDLLSDTLKHELRHCREGQFHE